MASFPESVPCAFVSVNRRNNEARAGKLATRYTWIYGYFFYSLLGEERVTGGQLSKRLRCVVLSLPAAAAAAAARRGDRDSLHVDELQSQFSVSSSSEWNRSAK